MTYETSTPGNKHVRIKPVTVWRTSPLTGKSAKLGLRVYDEEPCHGRHRDLGNEYPHYTRIEQDLKTNKSQTPCFHPKQETEKYFYLYFTC